jgi:excisionase family DNA binding protein
MPALLNIEDARRLLGVSRSTVWRMIRRGKLASVRSRGRRLVRVSSLKTPAPTATGRIPAFTRDHPMFRLVGAAKSGGAGPGATDKHAILES